MGINPPSLHQLHRMSSSRVISVSGGLLIGYKYDESGYYRNLAKKIFTRKGSSVLCW